MCPLTPRHLGAGRGRCPVAAEKSKSMSPLTPHPAGAGRIPPPVKAEKSKGKAVAGVLVVRAVTAREEDDPPECLSPLSIGIRRLKKLPSIKKLS